MRLPEFKRLFSDKGFSEMVDQLNTFFSKGIGLKDNMDGQIIEVFLNAGIEETVPHRLKAVPKYRIILRQDTSSTIYDGGDWNDNFITLIAGTDTNATILLMRG